MSTAVLRVAHPVTATQTRPRARSRVMTRFTRHRGGLVGALVVTAFILAAILAPLIAPHDPLYLDPSIKLQPPSGVHLLGTDSLGRDLLSRLLYGASNSLRVGIAVVFIGICLGIPIGAVSGYFGGIGDLLVQRLVDIIQAFPGILLLVLLVALAGPSLELSTVALGILSVPAYTRLVRASVLTVKQLTYVESARAVGASNLRIVVAHVLPNSLTPVIVQATLQGGTALLLLAGLSFLGLGAQPPTPEWGAMLAEGKVQMRAAPHVLLFPAMAVSLVVLGLNLVGDALRDALDPHSVSGHRG